MKLQSQDEILLRIYDSIKRNKDIRVLFNCLPLRNKGTFQYYQVKANKLFHYNQNGKLNCTKHDGEVLILYVSDIFFVENNLCRDSLTALGLADFLDNNSIEYKDFIISLRSRTAFYPNPIHNTLKEVSV